jgi:hypothetical protein
MHPTAGVDAVELLPGTEPRFLGLQQYTVTCMSVTIDEV